VNERVRGCNFIREGEKGITDIQKGGHNILGRGYGTLQHLEGQLPKKMQLRQGTGTPGIEGVINFARPIQSSNDQTAHKYVGNGGGGGATARKNHEKKVKDMNLGPSEP